MDLGKLLIRYGVDMSEVDRANAMLANSMDGVRKTASRVGTLIGGALGVSVGASAIMAAKQFISFDEAVTRVGVVCGASAEEVERLRDTAREMSRQTEYSATEVAQGMYYLGSAGLAAAEQLQVLPSVLNLATAGGIEMADATDLVVRVLGAFGLAANQSGRVADVLAQAVNSSQLEFQDLVYSMRYVAPVAAAAGISLEEVTSALSIMSLAGVKGEQAGTALRAALVRLIDPPAEAARAMAMLGVQVSDLNPATRSLSEILGILSERTRGMDEATRNQALSMLFGTEALSGMLTLVNAGPQAFEEMTRSLEGSAGTAERAAERTRESLGKQLAQLRNLAVDAAFAILEKFGPALERAIGAIRRWVEEGGLQKWLDRFTGAIRIAWDALGGLCRMISSVVGALGGFQTVLFGLASAWAAVKISSWISSLGGLLQSFRHLHVEGMRITSMLGGMQIGLGVVAAAIGIGVGVIGSYASSWAAANRELRNAVENLANLGAQSSITVAQIRADIASLRITPPALEVEKWAAQFSSLGMSAEAALALAREAAIGGQRAAEAIGRAQASAAAAIEGHTGALMDLYENYGIVLPEVARVAQDFGRDVTWAMERVFDMPGVAETVRQQAGQLYDALSAIAPEIIASVKSSIDTAGEFFGTLPEYAGLSMSQCIEEMKNRAKEAGLIGAAIPGEIASAIEANNATLKLSGISAIQAYLAGVMAARGDAQETISGWLDDVNSLLSSADPIIYQQGVNKMLEMARGLEAGGYMPKEQAEKLAELLRQALNIQLAPKVSLDTGPLRNKLSQLLEALKGMVGAGLMPGAALVAATAAIAKLRAYHAGGLVPGAGTVLGLLQGGEYIMPREAVARIGLEPLESMRTGSSLGNVSVHFHVGGFFGSQQELERLGKRLILETFPRINFARGA